MSQVPAGWYPDPVARPHGASTERYWDGFAWSHQVRPAQTTGTPAAGAPYPDRPYEAPTIPSTPDGQVLAGWWRRAGAALLDWLILLPLLVLVAVPSLVSHW